MFEHNNRTALVIEDDYGIYILLEQILKSKNFTPVHADSIAKTRLLLTEICPKVIFVDHRLPDGLGIDFIPAIREIYPEAKIIAMTAQNTIENRIKASQNGSDQFLEKPFLISQVYHVLDNLAEL